jgi:hypothetical protein
MCMIRISPAFPRVHDTHRRERLGTGVSEPNEGTIVPRLRSPTNHEESPPSCHPYHDAESSTHSARILYLPHSPSNRFRRALLYLQRTRDLLILHIRPILSCFRAARLEVVSECLCDTVTSDIGDHINTDISVK